MTPLDSLSHSALVPYILFLRCTINHRSDNSHTHYTFEHEEIFAMLFEPSTDIALLELRIARALRPHGASLPPWRGISTPKPLCMASLDCEHLVLDVSISAIDFKVFPDTDSACKITHSHSLALAVSSRSPPSRCPWHA